MTVILDIISTYIPKAPQGGALPLYLGFIASLAVFNGVQNFISPKLTKRVYSGKPIEVSGLSARTFAIWSFANAILRIYTCYDITNPALYDLSIISFVLAEVHFLSELLIFRTANLGMGILSPILAASSSLYWMITYRSYYLGL